MKTIADIWLLSAILVYIIDLSGFTQSWKKAVSRWLGVADIHGKPFDCALCMTWWCGLVLIAVEHAFTLPMVAAVAVVSYLTPVTNALLGFLKELASALMRLLFNLTDKIK